MLLEMAASGLPDRLAVGTLEAGATYAELHAAAIRAAKEFTALDADQVVLLARNHAATPIALFGAALAGLPYVPLNYLLPETSVRRQLERLGSPAIICDAEARTNFGITSGQRVIDVGTLARPLEVSPSLELKPPEPDSEAVRLFTSGTTAEPKAAVLRHRHLTAYVLSTVEFGSAAATEAVLLSVPPFHIAGVSGVISAVYRCRRIVPMVRFEAEEWVETVHREQITHAVVVPTMLARILEVVEPRDARLSSLQTLSYGGAPMPRVVIEAALQTFPESTGFVNAYGLTETSSTIAMLGPEDHRAAIASDVPEARERLRSVGRPVPSVRVEIRDESGAVVPPGVVGDITVGGEQVSGEYADMATQVEQGKWLTTGDRGWMDVDGYLFIEGRSDDLIIRGGENLSPTEIEDALRRHPDVRDGAVVGLLDEQWGECVAALVVQRPGGRASGADISEFVRAELGSIKAPELVVFADEVPRTALGKIVHHQVRREIEEAARSSVT